MRCPVCGKDSWCTMSVDGLYARCMRVESDRPAPSRKDGTLAWVHSVSGFTLTDQPKAKPTQPKTSQELIDLVGEACDHQQVDLERFFLASELGVSVESLESLRVGFAVDHNGEHTLWPCRSSSGAIVGAVRRYRDGTKLAIRGGSVGLFYAIHQSRLSRLPALVVEGGSDVAAAYTIGISAIGRPSNTGGVDLILNMKLNCPLVVVGERDCEPDRRGRHASCPSDCSGCANCYPGMYGAREAAKRLRCSWVMPPEGCKDLRDVLAQGRVSEFLAILSRK